VGADSGRGGKRPGAGRPKSSRDDISVKLDRTVAARARYVADLRGLTLAEYLTEAIRPIVDRDFDRAAGGGKSGGKAADR
jgi:hypothetical protein